MEYGTLLRDARLRCGLDQAGLARRAGTTQTYVSRVERGDVSPSSRTMKRLLHAMGLELVLETRPLSPGNVSLEDMRADANRTPAERVREAMEISGFLSGVAESARRDAR